MKNRYRIEFSPCDKAGPSHLYADHLGDHDGRDGAITKAARRYKSGDHPMRQVCVYDRADDSRRFRRDNSLILMVGERGVEFWVGHPIAAECAEAVIHKLHILNDLATPTVFGLADPNAKEAA